MRANGLNQRQAKFVALVAAGQHSVSQCHALAGYGDPAKPDSGNAHALKVRLADHIEEARVKLGLAPLGEEAGIDDAELESALALARATHAMAVEHGDVKSAVKAAKTIADILRRRGRSGRPVAEKTAPPPTSLPAGSGKPVSELIDLLLEEDDLHEIAESHPPHVEEAWLRWRQGGPSSEYLRIAYGVSIAEESSDPSALMSSASPIAISQAETVKRL